MDLWSWRAVFLPSAANALAAVLLLERDSSGAAARSGPIPGTATVALMVLLGAVAYFLMQGPATGVTGAQLALPGALVIVGGVALARNRHRHVLFPRELLTARKCLPANATILALYFGMLGLSFVVVLYVQQVLHYSASWASIVLLPMSLMFLSAERFGRLTASIGTRSLILTGSLSAAVGIGWMGTSSHPMPFWSHIIVGTGLFGLRIRVAVSALTHAAVAAVPTTYAGAASGLNHAVVRAAGLASVALLGSIASPGVADAVSAEGVQRALMVCAAVVGVGGVAGGAFLRNDHTGCAPGVASPKAGPLPGTVLLGATLVVAGTTIFFALTLASRVSRSGVPFDGR